MSVASIARTFSTVTRPSFPPMKRPPGRPRHLPRLQRRLRNPQRLLCPLCQRRVPNQRFRCLRRSRRRLWHRRLRRRTLRRRPCLASSDTGSRQRVPLKSPRLRSSFREPRPQPPRGVKTRSSRYPNPVKLHPSPAAPAASTSNRAALRPGRGNTNQIRFSPRAPQAFMRRSRYSGACLLRLACYCWPPNWSTYIGPRSRIPFRHRARCWNGRAFRCAVPLRIPGGSILFQ